MADRWWPDPVGLAVPVILLGSWEALVRARVLDYTYLPAPSAVATELGRLATSGELAADLAHTVAVAALALALALAAGGTLGLAIGLLPPVRTYVLASVDVLRTVPAVALLPVALLLFGPTPTAEVVLATYAATWPVLLHTAGGVAAVPARLYDVARTLRLARAATLWKVVLPAVAPTWLVGARVGAVVALLVTVVVEMVIAPRGLGGGLTESLQALRPARMWAYAAICGTVGYLLNLGLRRAVHHPSGPP
jgi:sulfonate transport system permease protein